MSQCDDRPQRQGGKKVTNSSRAKYLKQRALSNSLINGPGIFFTCPRGKEGASSYEFRDLLERVAEELQPVTVEDPKENTDDCEKEETMQPDFEDIETQIQRELEELKGGPNKQTSRDSNQTKRHEKFESKKMDCECLGFISFPRAYDPVEFATHIVNGIQQGRAGYGLRFILRITPISMTCSANSPPEFEKLVSQVLMPHFGIKSCPTVSETKDRTVAMLPPPREGLKFRIEPIVRCHDKPLNRAEVIRITGDVVNRFNADEYISVPDEHSIGLDVATLRHRVNIDDAQIVILVAVYRYVAGVSVVRGYDGKGKRFNLRALAETQEKEITLE